MLISDLVGLIAFGSPLTVFSACNHCSTICPWVLPSIRRSADGTLQRKLASGVAEVHSFLPIHEGNRQSRTQSSFNVVNCHQIIVELELDR